MTCITKILEVYCLHLLVIIIEMEEFANMVANICIEKYKNLRKTGKPSGKEWTVLSGILIKKSNGLVSLASLATGTKCLGGSQIINQKPADVGCHLSDSHAEVLARRGFIRYLYDQINQALITSKSDILFINEQGNIDIERNISFHFFSSQMPCGDCCIFPIEHIANKESKPPTKSRRIENSKSDISQLRTPENIETADDVHRTGAKCVEKESKQDPHLPGINYHVIGPLRIKPGRGDRTLSLSCSDKMAKWNFLGIQGSLLSILMPCIRLETITIGNGCPFSMESMERGLFKRFTDKLQGPKILQAQITFPHLRGHERMHPCPSSITWCATSESQTEIAVEGRKQGATKAKRKYLKISRRALLEMFLKICDIYKPQGYQRRHPKKLTYYDIKQSSPYHKTWNQLKREIFLAWPAKSCRLQRFVL